MATHVLVLIMQPGNDAMLDTIGREITRGPAAGGIHFAAPVWLSYGEACEIACQAPDAAAVRALREDLARRFAGVAVDIAVVPAADRRKRLLVADMDSTIIQQECIDEMADLFGLGERVAAITERAMRGEIAFEPALRERVGLLAGLRESDLERVLAERIRPMPGARTLVATMRRAGAFTALVSGGFTFFTSRIRALVGFDVDHANTLTMREGRLTGEVGEPILGREAKLAALEHYRAAQGLAAEATLAVGDGANDLAMIRAAGLGVAYRAKPVVAAEAAAQITHGDLTALLYLQGYRRDEFVA
jgi:phosphoserine phosphatase